MESMFLTVSDIIARAFSVIRITDLLDIAIVAFLIYKGTKLVRETRAEQLVKGIVVLLIMTQLCSVLHFNTMTYLLKYAMQFGALALVIVFQPELRRALEKLGGTRFIRVFSNETSTETDQMVDEIVKACASLQRQKIGALMVFERTSKLGDIMRSGIDMGGAAVSAELLINIFIPNTPLHDGAVVFRENKIWAATCILPLTKNENLSSELGTRHRAALGMTENSDAIVVIVSEETGKISLAEAGELQRDLTSEKLKDLLNEALEDKDANRVAKLEQFIRKEKSE